MDPVAVKESLVKDGCDAQRRNGLLPQVHDVDVFMQDIMRKLDRKKSDSKPHAPVRRDGKTKRERMQGEIERRARRAGYTFEGSWTLDKNVARPIAVGGATHQVVKEGRLKRLLRLRIRKLQAYPDWQRRFKCINPLALQGHVGKNPDEKAENQKLALELVRKIIRDSNVPFGPWWKARPPKLFSYKGQAKRA